MPKKTSAETTRDVLRAIEGALAGDAIEALKAAIATVEQQQLTMTVRVPLAPTEQGS